MANKGPVNRKEDLVIQEAEGELLIYDLRDNRALCLNKTSADVWQACDGTRNVAEISEHINREFGTKANEDLVWLALDQLKKEGLLAADSRVEARFSGMSRREVIKKIGIGSMVALPVIAAMVAPQAAYALSVCPTTNPAGCGGGSTRPAGCACSSPANCASGVCIPAQGGAIACCS